MLQQLYKRSLLGKFIYPLNKLLVTMASNVSVEKNHLRVVFLCLQESHSLMI